MHTDPSRGVPLVDAVIRARDEGRANLPDQHPLLGGEPSRRPTRWLGNRPLPPSLARWLTVDQGWLDGLSEPPLRLAALIDRAFGHGAGEVFRPLQAELLGEPCAALPGRGESSVRFLYLGPTDVYGEYAVLSADLSEPARVQLWSPGFDAWLAEEAGLIDVDRLEGQGLESLTRWRIPMARAAARVLGGAMTVLAEEPPTARRDALDVD